MKIKNEEILHTYVDGTMILCNQNKFMPKNNGQHLRFYINCMADGLMPYSGLCRCALYSMISADILQEYFEPDDFWNTLTFWASGEAGDFEYNFTSLRQTVVLFMAALNDEL